MTLELLKRSRILPWALLLALTSLLPNRPLLAQANNAEIRGTVYDHSTGEVLMYATLRLRGAEKQVLSDINGYYSFSRLAPGTYFLEVTSFGYDSFRQEITLNPGEKVMRNVYLNPSMEGEAVVIEAESTQDRTRVNISKTEITTREIRIVPSVGGEPDLAQYLQVIPGVIFSGDQGGQLYIRGGAPIQNKVILDGMTIYNPFHSIGLFSIFDVDIIKTADVYTGGYNASYGGRISAIMDVSTRDGNKQRFGGNVSVSPFTSKIQLEGPLKKFKEGEGGSSVMVSWRNSYLDRSAPLIYPYAGEEGLPYSFNDVYAKTSFYSGGGSQLSVFGFNFQDRTNFEATKYNWNSSGIGTRFFLIPQESSTTIEATFAYSDYSVFQQDADRAPRYSHINGFDGGLDFTYYSGNDQIKYGLDLLGFTTDFEFVNAANRRIREQAFTTELATYVRYNKVIGRLVLDPSFRLHYYASLGEFSPELRLGIKYGITDNLRLKGAAGRFSQNLLAAQSDQDVVNLFYGFLSGPDQLPARPDGSQVASRLQFANHAIAGFEYDVAKHLSLQIEGYYKQFDQLININRNKIFDNTAEFANKPAWQRENYVIETGYARGFDVLVKYDRRPYYIYAVYSHTRVERTDPVETYFPHWDRRHNMNLVLSVYFGRNNVWEATARFNYGSGFPFTRTQGFYELIDFQQGVATDYTRNNGQMGIMYSGYNQGRLPDYHRMDLSLKRTWKLSKFTELRVVASATNIYDRENIFYFDRIEFRRVNQLPILPALSAGLSF